MPGPGDNTRNKPKNGSDTDVFKRSMTVTMRAIAGDKELEVGFAKDRPAHGALCRMGWTTPESLQRQRAEAGLVDLRHFLNEFDLGLVVTAPRGSTTPSLLLALGTKVNKRPFTYPEVLQVQEIAEFMDNILARSRLTIQARQSEQLATIGLLGASLAHEIRNPLVSIKTFAHLLPSRFEGFGIPVLEAMASAVPVVLSGDPALREVAGEAGVYADDGDFAGAVRRALAERPRLGAAGVERAGAFSWRRTAELTVDVYRSVVA